MRTLVPVAVAALLAGGPAHAQDITSEIDEIFSWVTTDAPGCVIGVSQHGKVVVNRAYGMADLERGVALTPETIFDIGSTHKQFVAASVLLLVEDGRISLSDDIRKFVSELPDYGHKITIDHLLTHTSGIRDWVWLSRVTGAKEAALTLILRQRGLNFAPGEEWSYSNSGFVLLKEIVARVSGRTFAEFTRNRLFEPLGMNSTRYAHDVSEIENHALAYEREGERWRPNLRLGNARGGGGVFSTAGDLLIWNDALTNNRLGAFVSAKIQEPARLGNGRTLSYARGLILDERGIVWHSGSAAAYTSILARLPKQGVSFAMLCNAGGASNRDRGAAEDRIVDMFLPVSEAGTAADGPDPAGTAEVATPDLSDKAGLFFSERTGVPLRLLVNEGRLRVAGGPLLVTLSEDRFRNPRGVTTFMSEDEFELHFVSQDQLELKSMEGHATRYRRAQRYAPSAADLAAFSGRYETDEVGVIEIAPGTNGLSGRLNGGPPVELAPVDPDVFQLGPMTIRFRRDAAGKVIGLDLTNPAVRNVHFPRQGDGTDDRAAAPTETATTELSVYEGTYALQAPNRVIDLRVWLDAEGRLNGELVGLGQQTTFRPSTAHKFLHATRDDVWFLFTMEDGRATSVTAHQSGREMSGPRKQ